MRNRIISLLSLNLFVLCGCSDFLDEVPDNRLEIQTLDQVSEILVDAYPSTSYLFTDWYTSDCSYVLSNTQEPFMTDAFQWKDLDKYDNNGCCPTDYWMSCYKAISQANTALEKLNTITGDLDHMNAIKGEALLCRAYAHFMIASLFAENYDSETASSKLGIPYIDYVEETLLGKYKRGTLEETYTKIEQDLLAGISFVNDDFYSGSKKYHFTKKAANAFATRFYLYKKEYTKSIQYANSIIGEGEANPIYIKDLDAWQNRGVIEMFYFFIENSDPSNIMLVEKTVGIGLRHNYGYRTDEVTWSNIMLKPSVWGGAPYAYIALYGDNARNTRKAVKFYEEFYMENLTSTTGEPYYMHNVFRGEEVIFNRAECNISLGNYQEALDDLNSIGSRRFYDNWKYGKVNPNVTLEDVEKYAQTTDTKQALLTVLLTEKRREFIQEGLNWFDVKRLDLEVTHKLYDDSEIVLTPLDLRKILQIPYDAQMQGIEINPR